ncbi:putative methyltransferase-domain-containing protein [Radiomyces spectabilis]|uniref:putative methyltransferase-domain-containing protein n=1 Tax=Radiomyces spectabilis TaxID=64574 RepID=UPI0022202E3B|nr:putative methyltransferase-domain-containing protein [Radiomyces spectabilis]KAI8381245.1 putative methyltransferase-domain-containing protein [Radiomyces spectabilis]
MADERDEFRVGNLPQGLNVSASNGPPEALRSFSSNLALRQDVNTFGLAGKIWHSAYTIQAYFSPDVQRLITPQQPIPLAYFKDSTVDVSGAKPYRILELGAGTGYVGIALANMLREPCQVYITDLEQVVPLIEENIATHYQPGHAQVFARRLHWGNQADADALLADGPFDLVVISDCVYFPELFDILTDTLLHVCNDTTRVLIGYKCRSLEKEVGFWQDYFGRFFEYEPVRKLDGYDADDDGTDSTKDDEEMDLSTGEGGGGMFGEEEQVFIFTGIKRAEKDIKTADDTFITLMLCSIGI